jgi:hypothetical protein
MHSENPLTGLVVEVALPIADYSPWLGLWNTQEMDTISLDDGCPVLP